jgi:predicted DNA-binding transcriptional regulator AlpA
MGGRRRGWSAARRAADDSRHSDADVEPGVSTTPQGPGRKGPRPARARAPAPGLLLQAKEAALYLGMSVARFYDLRGVESFPRPVTLPGEHSHPRYRRADLDAWVAALPPKGLGNAPGARE